MLTGGRRIEISGTVQGVGFRPWVYRLARSAGLSGTVRNDARGVTIEAFGPESSIESFLAELEASPPPAAAIRRLRWKEIRAAEEPAGFAIVPSGSGERRQVSIPPDLATCPDCLREIFDPADRRYRYPFTNCTNCGPRLTIVQELPYDRPVTTMNGFEMCADCRAEYTDPEDRRFHAQPNACPACGPQLELWDAEGSVVGLRNQALLQAVEALRAGRIVATKGLGGFHLMVDARDEDAVARLRRRKHRAAKPLALMVPDVESAHRLCEVPPAAEAVLRSAASPILLLRRGSGPDRASIASNVAPGTPFLGLMIPYTPLHHLLLAGCGFPIVTTSGNLSDEPIAIDSREATGRLGEIADVFLVHDRPIERHADDSVVFVAAGTPRVLRRARGYAPHPIHLGQSLPPILALGAHMKNAVALSRGEQVFISQHIGDMETPQAVAAFERVIADLVRMLDAPPSAIAHDLHPGYPSTAWAERAAHGRGPAALREALSGLPTLAIQHHHAHLASCLAENQVTEPALGITWDGTGHGTDGTVWGGEFLLGDAAGFERVAHLRPFRMPGGDAAVREPRRIALALLWQIYGDKSLGLELAPVAAIPENARSLLGKMLESGVNAPRTTSAGRLFDGVAALVDLHQEISFEGQAAMALEAAATPGETGDYPMALERAQDGPSPLVLDWRLTLAAILEDLARGTDAGTIAARFHNTLARSALEVASHVGHPLVALTGGCFQNRLLTERLKGLLEREGLEVLLHKKVPANDGGISLGQIAVAAARLETGKEF